MGLFQPMADAIKSIFKEDLVVERADKVLFVLAPLIGVVFALLAFGAIPFGPPGSFFGYSPWVLNLDLGLLYLFAVSEMAIYGIFLAGWASGSKYSSLAPCAPRRASSPTSSAWASPSSPRCFWWGAST